MNWKQSFLNLTIIAAIFSFLALSQPAEAVLFSGAGGSGGGTLITTLTLANTSGSTVAANSVTPMFGHPFRKGDIHGGCSSGAPVFKLNDGVTNVPFSESLNPTCWSDGSLKFASFMLRIPTTIAGSGTLTIKIYSGGTTPTASGRTLSDFTAGGLDLNVSVTGADSTLSGTWTSDLGQAITAAHSDDYQFMDGQAGAVWRKRGSFRQSAADHGQLEGYWYVQALNDGSNALAGIRYMVRIAQPWYDVNSPAKNYRTLATMKMLNGASLVHDYMAANFVAHTFTWPGSGNVFTSTAHGYQTTWIGYLTTSGTLPTGLSTGTPYFINRVTANTFALYTSAGGALGGNGITPSGAGSGTFTFTPSTFVCIFCSIFTAATDGKMEYVQGNGSIAADPTIQVKFSNTYWRSTRMLPPYDMGNGINPTSTTGTITYFPQTVNEMNGFVRVTAAGGQSEDMGIVAEWSARHFFNQTLKDEQVTRIQALSAALQPAMLRNHASTGTIPCANNGSYSGLPTCNKSFTFGGDSGHTNGFTYVDTNAPNGGFDGMQFDHWGPNVWYAYLMSGEPEYLDEIIDFANSATIHFGCGLSSSATVSGTINYIGDNRCSSINGVQYWDYTWPSGTDLLRVMAWSNRDLQIAAAILPTTSYDGGTGETTYFKDQAHQSYLAANAYTAFLPAGAQALGVWNEATSSGRGLLAQNVQAFFMESVGYGAQLNEDSTGQTFYNYLALFPAAVYNQFGSTWGLSADPSITRKSCCDATFDDNFDPYITSAANFAPCGPIAVQWTSGGHFNKTHSFNAAFTQANGDMWTFNQNENATKPTGFSFDTLYYSVNTSGTTFDLSATLGGSVIPVTDTANTDQLICMMPANIPATGIVQANGGNGTYAYMMTAAMDLGKANAFTVDTATLSDITTRWQSYGGYVTYANGNPTMAFSSTPY